MSSRFDAAWASSDESLAAEMGEDIVIGGMPFTGAVVSEVGAGSKLSGMTVNSGVSFTVYLSRAQIDTVIPADKGAKMLKGKEVTRGVFKGRVMEVLDTGGAGAELTVGPLNGR